MLLVIYRCCCNLAATQQPVNYSTFTLTIFYSNALTRISLQTQSINTNIVIDHLYCEFTIDCIHSKTLSAKLWIKIQCKIREIVNKTLYQHLKTGLNYMLSVSCYDIFNNLNINDIHDGIFAIICLLPWSSAVQLHEGIQTLKTSQQPKYSVCLIPTNSAVILPSTLW